MTKNLHVSDDLKLPPDFVTSTAVIYGGKGMGKTNLGSVLVEECARAGLKFAVIDPMGVWWGLRFDVSGKGPGIELLIMGGIHGDIPIEPTGGAVVADLVADEDVSLVIDISRRPDGTMWSIAERVRFVTDYCKRIYQRQGEKRRPVMQFIDEAARFAPQVVRSGEMQVAACMGAVAVLVEEGRNVGIGVTLITQRSARLNKDVAELADAMIAFRTIGPNSSGAVLEWLGEHIEKKRLKDIGGQLRELPIGSALVVSPGWLQFEGVVRFRARETFDSSATPKPGQAAKKVSGGAKPDLAKYAERMAETIERAKATDPKALQAKVAELQAQVKKLEAAKVPAAKVVTKEVYVLKEGQLKRIEKLVEKVLAAGTQLESASKMLLDVTAPTRPSTPPQAPPPPAYRPKSSIEASADMRVALTPRPAPPPVDGAVKLNKGAREMLRALASFEQRGLSRQELGVHAVLGYQTGTFGDYLSALRRAGVIVDEGSRLRITPEGMKVAGGPQPPRWAADLEAKWTQGKIGGGARRMLHALIEAGGPMTRQELGKASELGHDTGTFGDYLSLLRRNGLIEDGPIRGEVRATDALYLAVGT